MEQIRKYHPKDKEQLATLIQLEMEFGENELKFLTEKCEVLIVYENNDKLIGFSFFRTLENHTQTGNCYTYVTPSMRNQGIGSKLHTEIFDIAKEAGIKHFTKCANTITSFHTMLAKSMKKQKKNSTMISRGTLMS